MTNIVGIAYTIIMALIFSLFLPWWTIVLPCFIIGLLTIEGIGQAFLIGFVSIFFLWLFACVSLMIFNESTLDIMIANLFQVSSPWILAILTAAIGGIVGGFASMSGTLFNKAVSNQ